jgi:hypothetical protein
MDLIIADGSWANIKASGPNTGQRLGDNYQVTESVLSMGMGMLFTLFSCF